jgi:hypothetical protein
MLLIIQNVNAGLTFAVSWTRRTVTPGVLNYRGGRSDEVGKWLAMKAKASDGPGDFMDRLGGTWHLIDGFVTAVQNELDPRDSTDLPSFARPDPQPAPHQPPST